MRRLCLALDTESAAIHIKSSIESAKSTPRIKIEAFMVVAEPLLMNRKIRSSFEGIEKTFDS